MVPRYNPTVVGITVALHSTWATALLMEPLTSRVIALHTMHQLVGDSLLSALVFGAVASLAILGMLQTRVADRVLLILPQHLTLWVSVVGIVYAVYAGQTPLGVLYPRWFLVASQVPVVLLALGHTYALVRIARGHHG